MICVAGREVQGQAGTIILGMRNILCVSSKVLDKTYYLVEHITGVVGP